MDEQGRREPPTGEQERERLLMSMSALLSAMETSTLPRALKTLLATDLTFQQLKVLTVLVTTPEGATVSGLADSFGVSTASMSTMLDRLIAQQAAHRHSDPQDARVRRVHATASGRQIVQRLVGARPEFAQDTLLRLSLDDLRALEQGMRAVAAAFSADAVH